MENSSPTCRARKAPIGPRLRSATSRRKPTTTTALSASSSLVWVGPTITRVSSTISIRSRKRRLNRSMVQPSTRTNSRSCLIIASALSKVRMLLWLDFQMSPIGWGIYRIYSIKKIPSDILRFFLFYYRHAEVSQCGNYILLKINKSCDPVNQLWYYDLKKANYEVKENLDFVKLVPNFDSRYDVC